MKLANIIGLSACKRHVPHD